MIEQIASKSGTALFALRCPNAECRQRFTYLRETGVEGELRCPNCGGKYSVELSRSYFSDLCWCVDLYRTETANG